MDGRLLKIIAPQALYLAKENAFFKGIFVAGSRFQVRTEFEVENSVRAVVGTNYIC